MTDLMLAFWPFVDGEWLCARCGVPVRLSEGRGVWVDGKPAGLAHFPTCPEED